MRINAARFSPVDGKRADSPNAKRRILVLACVIASIFLAEVFLFNAAYWGSLGSDALVVPAERIESDSSATYEADFAEPIDLSSISINGSGKGQAEILICDEGNARPYVIAHASLKALSERPLTVHPYGKVHRIVVRDADDDASIECFVLNSPISFRFSIVRVCALVCLAAFLYAFRGRSILFKLGYVDHAKRGRFALVAASVAVCLAVGAGSMINERWYGDFSHDGEGVVYSYPEKWHAQYAELARAFANGRLALDDEPPMFLSEMDNPYDTDERIALAKEFGDEVRWDTAYYDGQYYVYFGVLPVFVFYLPFYLITGIDFPTIIGCILCLWLFVAGCASLLSVAVHRWFREASIGSVLLCFIALVLSSMVVYCMAMPFLYQLPIVMGLCLLVWGLRFAISARSSVPRWFVASLFLSLILACRPQMFAYALFALILFVATLIHENGGMHRGRAIVAALVPFCAVVGLLLTYNAVRFGSPLDFGANYNLTTNDMTHRPASVELAISSLYYYYLQPPAVDLSFPFVHSTVVSFNYAGKMVVEAMYGGICLCAPCVVLSVAGLWSRNKRLRALCALSIALSLVVAVFDSLGAGLLARYALDFAFPMALSSVAFILVAESDSEDAFLWVRRFAIAAVLATVFFSAGLLYQGDASDLVGYSMLSRAASLF